MGTYSGRTYLLDYLAYDNIPNGYHDFVVNGVTINVEFYNIYGDVTYTSNTSLGDGTADQRMLIVMYWGNLTINSGVTLTATTRKKGMLIWCEQSLYNYGVISMTARGAVAAGQNIALIPGITIPAVGGNGGAAVSYTGTGARILNGNFGGSATYAPGGGGSGGAEKLAGTVVNTTQSGAGGRGTSYSGGTGGGSVGGVGTANSGAANGGQGGNGVVNSGSGDSRASSGGSGNPPGTGASVNGGSGNNGGTGTGGLLMVYAYRMYHYNEMQSRGTAPGNVSATAAATGGSSGSGAIFAMSTYWNANSNFYNVTSVASPTPSGGATGGSGGTGSATATSVSFSNRVTSVSLNYSSFTIDRLVQDGFQLTATVNPSSARDKSISWSSSNNNVATVNSSGYVTSVANGTCTITVTTSDGGFQASCIVTVKQIQMYLIVDEFNNKVYKSDGTDLGVISLSETVFKTYGTYYTTQLSGNQVNFIKNLKDPKIVYYVR